jgi:hypothetical protein
VSWGGSGRVKKGQDGSGWVRMGQEGSERVRMGCVGLCWVVLGCVGLCWVCWGFRDTPPLCAPVTRHGPFFENNFFEKFEKSLPFFEKFEKFSKKNYFTNY